MRDFSPVGSIRTFVHLGGRREFFPSQKRKGILPQSQTRSPHLREKQQNLSGPHWNKTMTHSLNLVVCNGGVNKQKQKRLQNFVGILRRGEAARLSGRMLIVGSLPVGSAQKKHHATISCRVRRLGKSGCCRTRDEAHLALTLQRIPRFTKSTSRVLGKMLSCSRIPTGETVWRTSLKEWVAQPLAPRSSSAADPGALVPRCNVHSHCRRLGAYVDGGRKVEMRPARCCGCRNARKRNLVGFPF
jgi:hypothetical protein